MVPVNVSAIIVTRGDVDLAPILDSLPADWERVVWDNGAGHVTVDGAIVVSLDRAWPGDVGVYGRYAAIEAAEGELIYVQDDDVVVSDPEAIETAWVAMRNTNEVGALPRHRDPLGFVVCNMPPEFRHDFYAEHALVGFGAAFHRDAPARAFQRFELAGSTWRDGASADRLDMFHRTCDVVFTALTPRILVDVPKINLPYAEADYRMYRQPGHQAERSRMLELAMKVKEAM